MKAFDPRLFRLGVPGQAREGWFYVRALDLIRGPDVAEMVGESGACKPDGRGALILQVV